jgi:hypothetical protein
MPNFRQSACGAARGRRGGHAKDGQSYQWIMLSAASPFSAARRRRINPARIRLSREFLNLQAPSRD